MECSKVKHNYTEWFKQTHVSTFLACRYMSAVCQQIGIWFPLTWILSSCSIFSHDNCLNSTVSLRFFIHVVARAMVSPSDSGGPRLNAIFVEDILRWSKVPSTFENSDILLVVSLVWLRAPIWLFWYFRASGREQSHQQDHIAMDVLYLVLYRSPILYLVYSCVYMFSWTRVCLEPNQHVVP